MSTTLTFADNASILYDQDNDKLYFNSSLTDASGNYLYFSTDTNLTRTINSAVDSSLQSYISQCITSYQTALKNGTADDRSVPDSSSSSKTLKFSYSESSSDYITLSYSTGNFSGWITDSSMFTTTTYTDANGDTQYTVTLTDDAKNTLADLVTARTTDIIESLTQASVTMKTDTGTTTATVTVSSTTTTNNKRYSSQVIPGDREVKVQSSCLGYQYIAIKLPAMNTGVLGIGGVDVTSHDSASSAITNINKAIASVSKMRTNLGATQNRLEAAMKVDDNTSENTQAAESLLRDADMAEESVAYAMHNILTQCGQSILAQANTHLRDSVAELPA